MIGVKPYIAFQGNCEEAINFYRDCLGGEILYMGRYGESPMSSEGIEDKILHCTLQIGDTHIMACDNMAGEAEGQGSNISLAIGCDDEGRMQEMFGKMAEGGYITMPLQETHWAKSFGMLTDKYGVNWMFNCEQPEDAAAA